MVEAGKCAFCYRTWDLAGSVLIIRRNIVFKKCSPMERQRKRDEQLALENEQKRLTEVCFWTGEVFLQTGGCLEISLCEQAARRF